MLPMKALHGACNGQEKLYVDDVFSTYLYTGNGSTQTINNGIDLVGKGGLVWIKGRSGATNHQLFDTARTATYELISDSTVAQVADTDTLTAFNSTGFALGADATTNTNAATYASWTFRKAAKFFDVQTISHTNGAATNITLSDLGTLGQVVAKITNTTGDWIVWHRSLTAGNNLRLNTTAAQTTTNAWLSVSGTTATLSASAPTGSYVIYAFAHDDSADGIIQCGSFTTDGSGNATVNLGWEPQFVTLKVSSEIGNWFMQDAMRNYTTYNATNNPSYLVANTSAAETTGAGLTNPIATGFKMVSAAPSTTYIYLAIRRPNKPPKTGAEVFMPTVYTGTNTDNRLVDTTIAPDMVWVRERNDTTPTGMVVGDRLRGNPYLWTGAASIESTDADSLMTPTLGYGNTFSAMNGFGVGNDATSKVNIDTTANNHIAFAFKRAPGFMDTICFTGTGSNKTESHSLGKAPELWVVKGRSGATPWVWGSSLLANTEKIVMPSPAGKVTDATAWNSTYPTASVISLGTAAAVNTSSATYVCYLWATVAGISKVFSYTGDGGSGKVINCGFSAGARFVLIVRTDTTGSFLIWDSVRGIVAANDPHLALDTTAAEVTTDDSIDPDSTGFAVNQVAATNINVNNATYLGLAIA